MINRRNFIKSAAAASGLMLLPAWAAGKGKGPGGKHGIAELHETHKGKNAHHVLLFEVFPGTAAQAAPRKKKTGTCQRQP